MAERDMAALPPTADAGRLTDPADTDRAHAGFLAQRRFGSLDGLRFFCILAVLWHHSPAFMSMQDPAQILTRGFLGVDFFFVLSGFLITTLLLRERATHGRFSLRRFYWRRALRILPPYLLVVTVVSVWFVLLRGRWADAPLVPAYYLFLANFLERHLPFLYPLWSLSVEEQYYLIWPALLALLPGRAVLPVLAVLVAANVAGILGAFGTGPTFGVLHFGLPHSTYAPILLGSALAVLLESGRGFALMWRIVGGGWAALWSAALVLAIAAFGPENLLGFPNLVMHLAMTLCLASLVVREDNAARALLSWRPVARIGEISYGVYLYHMIGREVGIVATGTAGIGGDLKPWLTTLVYLAASVAIAELSFRTLEAWFRRLRHKPSRSVPSEAG